MRIERRKLSYNNKQRDQVVTTLNAEFLREIGIAPDIHVNLIYEEKRSMFRTKSESCVRD